MKEFDVNKIGKGMPYKAPSEEFFTNFKSELMVKVTSQQKKMSLSTKVIRLAIPAFTAAASLLIGVFVIDKIDHKGTAEKNYLVSDNIDASIDSYFDNLSDDELAYLLNNTSSQDDFYSTLPEN